MEEALAGQEAGFEAHLHLEPEQAFGDYRSELVCFEARELFPEQLEVGMHFEGLPEGSVTPDMPADAFYIVTEIYPRTWCWTATIRWPAWRCACTRGARRARGHR